MSSKPTSHAETPTIDFEHYHNYAEIVDILLSLNATYPNLIDVFSIGKSWNNRDIYCVRLTNEATSYYKPELFFVGYHHAREPISAELPLYFIVHALENYGSNETITRMLNLTEIYIVVALNVDAFDSYEMNEWQRKNIHPFDEDGDGKLDEDIPEDEDGDGLIEVLWVWNGTAWVEERWEGVDDDGDGLLNEDWVGGVDLNRNYGYAWNATTESGSTDPWDEDFKGPAPFSEPETQVIRDFVMQHNFKYAVSFHSGTELIIYPWGYTTEPTPHDQLFEEIASDLSSMIGAPYGQAGSGLYTTSGSWDDWMYGSQGVYAFTCEIFVDGSAWTFESGHYPDSVWQGGISQAFNPIPSQIETVVIKWLPVFDYLTDRSIERNHDIAITNVEPSTTSVEQGDTVSIDVTIENQGYYTETFDITLYYDDNEIETQTVHDLAPTATMVLPFNWDTTDIPAGDYTLSANGTIVLGETDIEDNSFTDGTVQVEIGRVHDVAIIDIIPNKTIVCQNYTVNINSTVENKGDVTETFNVSIYYNTSLIETQPVTVDSNESRTLTFTWNTTAVPLGNYTISGNATSDGDTNTTNNVFIDGWIVVTVPGDLNGDFKVNYQDLFILASAYGSTPEDEDWNPHADLNSDDEVNYKDLFILSSNYGEEWTGP